MHMSPLSDTPIIITCQAGLESLVKRDTERCHGTITDTQDRLIFARGTEDVLYRLLLKSRYANRIYLELAR